MNKKIPAKKINKKLTHKELVGKMLKNPKVKTELSRLNREEFAILDEDNKIIMSSSDEFFRKNQEFYTQENRQNFGKIIHSFSLFNLNSYYCVWALCHNYMHYLDITLKYTLSIYFVMTTHCI
jgi:phosphatidate phosphatase PAH1